MARLAISLFGSARVSIDGVERREALPISALCLLSYMLLNRERVHRREILAGIFWGDMSEDRARHCLRTSLWRLRKLIEPDGGHDQPFFLITSRGEIGVNVDSDLWLDIAEFESSIPSVNKSDSGPYRREVLERLERAVDLYAGDLLEGVYSDWVLRERERLRSHYLRGLSLLMRAHGSSGHYDTALHWGRKMLMEDPMHEAHIREMMRLYVLNGQRAEALRQYETSARLLRQELSIDPMTETRALYQGILAEDLSGILSKRQEGGPANLDLAAASLRQLLEEFDMVKARLHEALDNLERGQSSQQ